jgi:methyl-accepting chemotaxis protein
LLPTINESVHSALTAIEQTEGIYVESAATSLTNSLSALSTAVKNHGLSTASFELSDPKYNNGPLVTPVSNVINGINQLSGTISATITTIGNQYLTISNATKKANRESIDIAMAVAVVLLLLSFGLALRVAAGIARSVRSIESAATVVSNGDLTQLIDVRTRDEIGRLSARLNDFLATLRQSRTTAQEVSSENLRMKEQLIAMTEQASASSNEITANTESISAGMRKFDQNMNTSSEAIQQITESISLLDGEVQEQVAMVEESTASVTQGRPVEDSPLLQMKFVNLPRPRRRTRRGLPIFSQLSWIP